jgi:hypothetical protein
MGPAPPASIKPTVADCVTTMKAADPEAPPQEFPSKVFRARDGKTRIDNGEQSVITDPGAKQSILLDHTAKEIRVIPFQPPPEPLPKPPEKPGGPETPAAGVAGFAKPVKVEDLGKKMIDGQEAEGKRFTYKPPKPPPPPKMPEAAPPGAPGVKPPELKAPEAAPPEPPDPEVISEVWTSTKLNVPVLTKTTSPFGEQICKCKYTEVEPPPTMFEIPAEYKKVEFPPPTPPQG